MCTMDNESLVLRGKQLKQPYDHIVKIYSVRGTLLHSWPSKCHHNWSAGIICIPIDSTHYIIESCPDCQQIRLYTIEGGSRRIAYENRAHSPGKMCIGWSRNEFKKQSGSHVFDYDEWCIVDLKTKSETKSTKSQNTLLVYDSKGKNILELDCSTKKFQLIRSHETGLCGVSGMCYVRNKDMLVLTSQEDHMIKAVNIDNGNTMWCLHFRIEGKICQPWDVKYDAHTSYLFVADGDNKRMLLLSEIGQVKQILCEDKIGSIFRLIICEEDPRLVIRDSKPNQAIKCFNVKLVHPIENQYSGCVHPILY